MNYITLSELLQFTAVFSSLVLGIIAIFIQNNKKR